MRPAPDERPSWDDTWLNVAWIVAKRSRCSLAQVGAVIVTVDQKIASAAYNGPPAGLKVEGYCDQWCERGMNAGFNPAARNSADYSTCDSIHAETNALLRADHSAIRGGTVYVSRACCVNCARSVANSGVSRVVHAVSIADRHRDPDRSDAILTEAGLEVMRAQYDSLGYPPRMRTNEGVA